MISSFLKTLLTLCLSLVIGAGQADCACAPASSVMASSSHDQHGAHMAPAPADHDKAPSQHHRCDHCRQTLLAGASVKGEAIFAPSAAPSVKLMPSSGALREQPSKGPDKTAFYLRRRTGPPLSPVSFRTKLLN